MNWATVATTSLVNGHILVTEVAAFKNGCILRDTYWAPGPSAFGRKDCLPEERIVVATSQVFVPGLKLAVDGAEEVN